MIAVGFHARFYTDGTPYANGWGMYDCLMQDRENAETFFFIWRIVGADFGWVKGFLVATISEILKVSATHVVVVVVEVEVVLDFSTWNMQRLHFQEEIVDLLEIECLIQSHNTSHKQRYYPFLDRKSFVELGLTKGHCSLSVPRTLVSRRKATKTLS